jgi:hypothetical protein
VNVGEIAASAAGDQDLFAKPIRVLQHGNAAPAPARLDCAHQSSGPASENDCIE